MGALDLQLDPGRPAHITIVGRKRSGKSVLAQLFWASWPHDALVIDPTGDIDAGEDAEELTAPFPIRFPTKADGERTRLRFFADPGSPTYTDDLDRAVGLAFFHPEGRRKPILLWVDEVGEITNANRTPPHTRRTLHQSRHKGVSLLLCGPRPIDVNPLVISQADYLAVFDLPNPNDRKRVADSIGLDLDDFEDAHRQLAEHGFLWWDAARRELTIMPPLPRALAARAARATSRTAR